MNEEYLINLHASLGVEDDFSTWINAVKDNDDYLTNLHASLGVEDNFATWKSSVMGNEPGKTIDPASESMDSGSVDGSLEQPKPSKASTLASSLAVGFVEFAKGFENLKEGVQLGTYELINEVGGFLTGEGFEMSGVEKQAAIKAIRKTNVLGDSESYDPIISKLEENIPEYETKSITEDLEKGNYAQAGFRTVNAALRSAPSLVAAATGVGGLVALGASTAGNKFEEEFEADPEKSTGILLANAGVTGTTEAAFELVTRGLFKRAGFLKGQGNVKAAKELLQGGAKNIVKNIGFGLTAEGASEAATELTVAFEDYIMLGKEVPKKDLLYRLGDAAIVGSFIGGTISSVGEVTKTMPNAKNRAEAILMPENVKQQISKKAEELNEFIDDLPSVSPEGKGIVVDKINEIESEIIDLKKESSLLINNLKGEDLVNYSKNIEEINKVKNVLNNAKTDSEKDLAEQKYKTLQEENVSILKDAKVKAAEVVTETVKKQIKEAGLEGQVTEMTSEEISNIEEKGFDSKTAAGEFGFIKQSTDGSFEIILNKDKPMVGTAAHEFMHAVLFKTIGNNTEIQDNLGDALVDHVSALGGETSILGERLSAYGKWDGDTFVRDANFGEETITIMSESIVDGSLKFEENLFTKIGDSVRRLFQKIAPNTALGRIKFDTGRDVYNFVKDYSKSIKDGKINKAILNVAKEGAKGKLVEGKVTPEATTQMSKDVEGKTPEQLVKTIQRGGNPKKVKEAQDKLAPQFELLALSKKALNYDTRTGDIAREDVAAEAMTYFDGIVERFTEIDPKTNKKRKFSTFVVANMFPKRQVIYEKVKPLTYGETTSTDTKEARQIEDTSGETTNTEKTFVQKINILQDFAITNRVANKIKALVKVAEGDTFKQVISKYAGKVGELIFDIPAEKITDGKANLIPTTKYKDGMPIPAEAQNIQRFFQAGENMSKFIKSLPKYNVADKNADIDKIGENIETPRSVFGVAVGLRGLPLDYFYENYTDPKAFSKDPDVYEQRITSKGGRSRGVSTQTQVKKLKPEFINPTPEIIEKAKRDIGITPKLQENVYNRDIGQLQKGFAKVYSINASLSGGQRFLADKLAKAPVEKKPAIKKQIASVTAAQGKIAFSKNNKVGLDNDTKKLNKTLNNSDNIIEAREEAGNIDTEFIDKENRDNLNKNLAFHGLKPMHTYDSATNIDFIIKEFKRISTVLNQETANYTIFFKSDRHIPASVRKNLIVDPKTGKKIMVRDYYKREIKKAFPPKTTYGKQFIGPASKYKKGKKFGKLYGQTPADFRAAMKTGRNYEGSGKNAIKLTIPEINEMHESMGTQLWQRINDDINGPNGNRENARIWANYLAMATNNTEHPHRQWAEFIGWTKNPLGSNEKGNTDPGSKGYKVYEWEHAMQSAKSINYLMHSILGDYNFDAAFELIRRNYKLIALDNYDDKVKLKGAKRTHSMGDGWSVLDAFHKRYQDEVVAAVKGKNGNGINPEGIETIFDGKTMGEHYNINTEGQPRGVKPDITQNKMFSKAINKARTVNPAKGITVLDFDDTLATSKSLVISTSPDGAVRKLTAEEFATEGADLLDQGWTHDFSEFSKVVDGKVASLFKKAMKLQGKFGPENMFVLTARPADSAPAIFEFLKANGLNIPLKNITGLANSTPESKALWIADKVADGYNDFYFADDALQNVQAVDNMLEQFDVKRKVQQAKIKFSKGMNDQFNDILENVTGIESGKRFSIIKGRKRGESKGKFRVFIPPSHEDFVGLLYNFLGKGKEGNAHRDFFEQALIRPLNRANREFDTARQSVANDYKELNKQFEDVRKKLTKKTADGDFTFQDAIRVYLWNKHGHKIPGLSEADQVKLVELVQSDSQLQSYAETLNVISKQEAYVNPTDGWNGGDIRMDLDDATGRIGRKQFFAEFIENADVIFSEENLNKIEAGYGKSVRESLEDMLYRIETGRNRPTGQNEQVNKLMNYLNGSVGTVMFFNMRSALLQQMSIVNYINFADNNIFAAAKAFANQKQYWKDFAFIFNSDMLKQRRGGIQTDINGAELAASLRNSKDITRKLISKLLELGFLPTQIGDNIAIATGGAAYYRNRINKYIKQGMSQKEAEAAAFTDFQDITQSTQQSARPDMVSKQQASVIGKVILNFQNVTSQFNRLGKKAFQDIYNRRITKPNTTQMQSDISNAARITYYFAVQNAIFYTLQTALFAMMFDDDEEDVNNLFIKKQERLINGSIDSVLRGSGLIGGVVATLKNVAIAFARQRDIKYNPDESAVGLEALNLSPVLGIKLRKIVNAEKTLNYNKKVIKEMETFDIDNPQWSAVTNYTEAFTNIPLNRLYNKTQNVRQALNNDHAAWERTLMFLGWSQYNLDLENKKMDDIKEKTKSKKKKRPKSRDEQRRENIRNRTR